jgi:hypothetical protein
MDDILETDYHGDQRRSQTAIHTMVVTIFAIHRQAHGQITVLLIILTTGLIPLVRPLRHLRRSMLHLGLQQGRLAVRRHWRTVMVFVPV